MARDCDLPPDLSVLLGLCSLETLGWGGVFILGRAVSLNLSLPGVLKDCRKPGGGLQIEGIPQDSALLNLLLPTLGDSFGSVH